MAGWNDVANDEGGKRDERIPIMSTPSSERASHSSIFLLVTSTQRRLT
jgi:hypothetical protein